MDISIDFYISLNKTVTMGKYIIYIKHCKSKSWLTATAAKSLLLVNLPIEQWSTLQEKSILYFKVFLR